MSPSCTLWGDAEDPKMSLSPDLGLLGSGDSASCRERHLSLQAVATGQEERGLTVMLYKGDGAGGPIRPTALVPAVRPAAGARGNSPVPFIASALW